LIGNIEFWHPIRAEGRQNQISDRPQNGLKTTATDIDEFTITFESVLTFNTYGTNKTQIEYSYFISSTTINERLGFPSREVKIR
jgi:hypothetical protein